MKTPFNKAFYVGFCTFGCYQILKQDYMQAASFLGIALAFDPFDVDQGWKQRPLWQKAILIFHLALVAGLFGLGVGLNER
jgi:putative Mn2+ efflux pump MntP